MKFGKKILVAKNSSDPEWFPFWPNYKMLKTKIKDIQVEQEEGMDRSSGSGSDSAPAPDSTQIAGEVRCDPSTIQRSTAEVAFFKALHGELRKGSDFFTSMGTQYLARLHRIYEGLRQLQNTEEEHKTRQDATSLLAACLRLYKELIMLENFAVMSHTAFSKILKKHDKRTLYRTREQFMRNKVNVQSFARYPELKEMLGKLEDMYREINALQKNFDHGSSSSGGVGGGGGGSGGPHPHSASAAVTVGGSSSSGQAGAGRTVAGRAKAASLGGVTPSTQEIEEARTLTRESKTELDHELSGSSSAAPAASASSASSSAWGNAEPAGGAAASHREGGGGRASPRGTVVALLLAAAGQVQRASAGTGGVGTGGVGCAGAAIGGVVPAPKPKSRNGPTHTSDGAAEKRQRT